MLACSIFLSKQGVGFDTSLWWIGATIAVSLSCSEFMFNDQFNELSWTAVLLGLGAYIYSIHTNIVGFYFYRHIDGTLFSNFDPTNFFGGIFMDVYPEVAISWALGYGKVGDLLGNLVRTWRNPESMTTGEDAPSTIYNPRAEYRTRRNQAPRHRPVHTPSPLHRKDPPTYHPITYQQSEAEFEQMIKDNDLTPLHSRYGA